MKWIIYKKELYREFSDKLIPWRVILLVLLKTRQVYSSLCSSCAYVMRSHLTFDIKHFERYLKSCAFYNVQYNWAGWIGKAVRKCLQAADPCHVPLKWVHSASSLGLSAALLIRFSIMSSWKCLVCCRFLWNIYCPPTHHRKVHY